MEVQYRGWRADCSSWSSDVETFDETLSHAIDDLRALYLEGEDGPIISAGIPWYSAAFGRDSIITSLQTLPLNPQIAVDTLRYLARYQGTHEDLYTEEQPGKIMHELRRGELARSGDIPHVPYYGTIDATPLWLVLLHETWRWTGDEALVRELLPNAERAVEWIDRYGDVDGDGFVEYAPSSSKGLVNQGWKDSSDGVPFPDGRLPQGPIALVEVQGYVADAKLRTAALLNALGYQEKAAKLREQAVMLGDAVRKTFWLEELGTFALALDGAKRPLPTVTSNAAHLLWSRVPSMEQASRLAGVLLSPEMFSGWGIRTLSAAHAAFNPMSYHNGSVWPHDNSIMAAGMRRYGFRREAELVARSVLEATMRFTDNRVPELFCGFTRDRRFSSGPGQYLVSCSPQAWGAGALFHFLQTLCGVHADVFGRRLRIDPLATPLFDSLRVEGMRVGGGTLDFTVDRSRGGTRVKVDRKPSGLELELPA